MRSHRIHGGGTCLFVLGTGLLLCLGCGGEQGEPTYVVTGTVTHNGAPAAGVAVTFEPEGATGQSAVGVTDAIGKYSLTTRKQGDGALAGKYRVTFAKYEGQQSATTDASKIHASYDVSNEYPAGYNESAASENQQPAKNLLPAQFADPSTSGHTAVVTKGPNKFDFDLKGG